MHLSCPAAVDDVAELGDLFVGEVPDLAIGLDPELGEGGRAAELELEAGLGLLEPGEGVPGVDGGAGVMRRLATTGIDRDDVGLGLEPGGVASSDSSFQDVLAALAAKPARRTDRVAGHGGDEDGWVPDETVRKTVAVYQVLPGPEAHELCVSFGRIRGGKAGAFAAGLGFMLPGFLLMLGFSVAFRPDVLLYAFLGCLVGTLVGMLPGIGPLAGMSILLPVTYGLDATKAIIMLAGIYYGSQYGGSTTAILVNMPGETSSVEFLGHQFDLGLAWVHFPEGRGGLGLPPVLQKDVDRRIYGAGAKFPGAPHFFGLAMAGPTIVTNGDDAIVLLQRHPYGVVLLDEQMPGRRGLEVFRAIRVLDQAMPVVMVTKSEEADTLRDAIGSDMFRNYLVPFEVVSMLLLALPQPWTRSSSTRPTAATATTRAMSPSSTWC